MTAAELTQLVLQAAQAMGFDQVGIAAAGPSPDLDRFRRWLAEGYDAGMTYLARRAAERADLRHLMPGARSVILLAAVYHVSELPPELRDDPSRGLIASYAWGTDYHDLLKPLLFRLDAALRQASGREERGRAFVDTAPVLERSWARQAGLGFIGKNTCLIAPRLGSWLFLCGLLVPEELAGGSWILTEGSHGWTATSHRISRPGRQRPATCGGCVRCLDVCPTAAFPEPHVVDSRRCISYLTIEHRGPIPRSLRPQMGNWVFGCDLCQAVCPYNRRFARRGRLAAPQPTPDTVAPKLLDLLALDTDGFRQRFRGSPLKRAKRAGLLRNVCVALGNWADPSAVPGLVEALNDREPLIRGHAAWALGQVNTPAARAALKRRQVDELDAFAVREIVEALA